MKFILSSSDLLGSHLLLHQRRDQSRMAWKLIRNGWKMDFDYNEFRQVREWKWCEPPSSGDRNIKTTNRAWLILRSHLDQQSPA